MQSQLTSACRRALALLICCYALASLIPSLARAEKCEDGPRGCGGDASVDFGLVKAGILRTFKGLKVTGISSCSGSDSEYPNQHERRRQFPEYTKGWRLKVKVKLAWKLPKNAGRFAIAQTQTWQGADNPNSGDVGDCSEMQEGTTTFSGWMQTIGCDRILRLQLSAPGFRSGAYAEIVSAEYLNDYRAPGDDRMIDNQCQDCTSGVTVENHSVSVSIPFGLSSVTNFESNTMGRFYILQTTPSANLFTPAALEYGRLDSSVDVIKNSTNSAWIRQVKGYDGLADVVCTTNTGYEVRLYSPGNVLQKTNGLYSVTNTAHTTYIFQNAEPANTNSGRLWVIEKVNSLSKTNEFKWITANDAWCLIRPDGLSCHEVKCVLTNGNNYRIDTHEFFNTNSPTPVALREIRCYTNYAFGMPIVDRILTNATGNLISHYEYFTATNQAGYGQLKQATLPGGDWVQYTYDSAGRLKERFQSFLNQGLTTNTNLCRYTWYDYAILSGSGDSGTDTNALRTEVQCLLGKEVSRKYWVHLGDGEMEIQCVHTNAAWNNVSNLVTTTRYYTNGSFNGWLRSVLSPDGTMSLYEYQTTSSNRTDIIWNGQPNVGNTAVVAGSKSVTVRGLAGQLLSSSEYDVVSGLLTDQVTYSNFDHLNRPQRVTHLDGTYEDTSYGCCGVDSTTDRDGVSTSYTYDSLKRRSAATRLGISSLTTYDAQSRVTSTQRQGTDSSLIVQERLGYDIAGRVTARTNALGGVTTYAYSVDGSGQFVKTTVFPDGGTRIDSYYADGQIAKVTGTAINPMRYEIGVEQDAGNWRVYRKLIKLDGSGNDTAEWTKTYEDMIGRGYKTVYNNPGGGIPKDEIFYNTKGQEIRASDPDVVTTLKQYNAEGELEYVAIDLNNNGVIDFAGTDRITRTVSDVTTNGTVVVRRTRIYEWVTNTVDSNILVSTTETAVDGSRTWQTAFGVTSQARTVFAGSGNRYVTNSAPDGSRSIQAYANGRPVSDTRLDANGVQLSKLTFGYDTHGRQFQVNDARSGTTTLAYNAADLVVSTISPAPGTGQNRQTTSTTYDSMGRSTNVVQADGTKTFSEYYSNGLLKKRWGSKAYPVEYTYDSQGRIKTLKTWQNFAANSGTAITTWNYSTNRGFLINKRYADNQGPNYVYGTAGRLEMRTWARGWATLFSYNGSGDLDSVWYTDSTSPIIYSYDRRGRNTSITRLDGTVISRNFHDAGVVLSESYSGGILGGYTITNTYDSLLRRITSEGKTASSNLYSHAYTYDDASRMSSVSDGVRSASYEYVPNSALISQTTFKENTNTRMVTKRNYDYLNRLLSINSSTSSTATPHSAYRYLHNDGNQRVRMTLHDGSYWLYEYDSLGQVVSGKHFWPDGTLVAGQQMEYAFDDIGNRKSTQSGGDETGSNLRTSSYAANALNQYTNRTVPRYLDVQGIATAGATVTVNGQSTYRRGEYFRKELDLTGNNGAIWQGVTNSVAGGATQTGALFLPASTENSTYDADGNLTSDVRWTTILWDAENRLIELRRDTAPDSARLKVTFSYDWMGRRVRKTTYTWNGTGWTQSSDSKFLYDGWNVTAELDGATGYRKRTFMWGLDLSGSEQGAGGVGGLIKVSDYTGTQIDRFAVYDGNGNVTGLTSAVDGSLTARYEYGPFGELERASGTDARNNCIRFSSKWQDDESGYVYYGYRYYDAGVGRWLGRDPLGELGGKHLYGFNYNNPIQFYDPDGRNPGTIVIGGGAAIGAVEIAAGIMGISAAACLSSPDCLALAAQITQDILDDIAESAKNLLRRCRPKQCLPCSPPKGSIAYRVDLPPSDPHNGIPTPHSHKYAMHQSPPKAGCKCFWKEMLKDPLPGILAPPIAPAAGGGIAP